MTLVYELIPACTWTRYMRDHLGNGHHWHVTMLVHGHVREIVHALDLRYLSNHLYLCNHLHLLLYHRHGSLCMIALRVSSTFSVTMIFSHISLNGGTSYTDPITVMQNAALSIIVAVAVIDIGYNNLMAHHRGSLPVAHRWW